MPIKVPNNLPAIETLTNENVFVFSLKTTHPSDEKSTCVIDARYVAAKKQHE